MERVESASAHAMKTTPDILRKLHTMIAAPTKSNNQSEPTMSDLMDSIAELRGMFVGLSDNHENLTSSQESLVRSHENLTKTVSNLSETMNVGFDRIDGVLSTLQFGQDNLLVEVLDIKRRVIKLEFQMADVQDTLSDLGEAETKDALASMNHEVRIVRLEKINNIESVSVSHLREIE